MREEQTGMDEYKLLTDAERTDFMDWEKGFESDFWRKLCKDLQEELDSSPGALFWAVKSYEELVAARARLQAVAQLLAYPKIIENKKYNLMYSRNQEAAESKEDDSVSYL